MITVFEEIPKFYANLPGEGSFGDRVKAFEKKMLEFSGKFRFTTTGTGFGWSIDYSRHDLPPNPFPELKEGGRVEPVRTLRWRARGIKVVADRERN